jgi:hypothetical protein
LGTVPELQLLPVVKLPEPVALHDTSAARTGTTAIPPMIAMAKQALCCQRAKKARRQKSFMGVTDGSPIQEKTE